MLRILMGLGILTLKKAAGYALFKMPMGISGKDPAEIFKSITLHKIRRAEGLSFLRNRGVTYVTGHRVAGQEASWRPLEQEVRWRRRKTNLIKTAILWFWGHELGTVQGKA